MKNKDELGMHAGAKPEIFRFAEKLRANMTEEESKIWEHLRLKPKGFRFRRQHPFSQYVLDFYCHKLKLAIEVDGKYHETNEQRDFDKKRTDELNYLGIQELRFNNEDVNDRFEEVLDIINSYLDEAS